MADPEALAQVLARLATELDRAHQMGREVEDHFGRAIRQIAETGGTCSAAGALGPLQDLDRLVQTVENLARFVGALGAQLSHDPRVDPEEAARVMGLRDLAHRLTGQAPPPSVAGDLHLF